MLAWNEKLSIKFLRTFSLISLRQHVSIIIISHCCLILNHAIFIIPFANHRCCLCVYANMKKELKDDIRRIFTEYMEVEKKKIIIITLTTVILVLFMYAKSIPTSIFAYLLLLLSAVSPETEKKTHNRHKNEESILLMKNGKIFLIIHQMHSHVAFNL